MTTVSVLGSGIMATALAFPLSDNGHEVRLIGTHLDREIIDSIKESGVHPGLDLEVPQAAIAFQLEEAEEAFDGADVVLSGVNSFGVRWAGGHLAKLLKPGMHVLSIAKGMEATESGDLRILPEVLAGEVSRDLREQVSWSAIAGPSIAGEVAVRRNTCVVFTGRNASVLEEMASLFRTPYYHVWTSTDFVGVEVCAAAKNCYALGAGLWRAYSTGRASRRRGTAITIMGPRSSARRRGSWGGSWNCWAATVRHHTGWQGLGTCSSPAWEDVT
jgi:glycerol-3-phosphate dehydrogenase (NAD(P)+)